MACVEFFFDYGSPYRYLADTRRAGLAERTIVYRAMLLGGVFKATGNNFSLCRARRSEAQVFQR